MLTSSSDSRSVLWRSAHHARFAPRWRVSLAGCFQLAGGGSGEAPAAARAPFATAIALTPRASRRKPRSTMSRSPVSSPSTRSTRARSNRAQARTSSDAGPSRRVGGSGISLSSAWQRGPSASSEARTRSLSIGARPLNSRRRLRRSSSSSPTVFASSSAVSAHRSATIAHRSSSLLPIVSISMTSAAVVGDASLGSVAGASEPPHALRPTASAAASPVSATTCDLSGTVPG